MAQAPSDRLRAKPGEGALDRRKRMRSDAMPLGRPRRAALRPCWSLPSGQLAVKASQFDPDPGLINCLNGTLDLRP